MGSSRGILFTALMVIFLLVLFGAFTLFAGEPGQQGAPSYNASGPSTPSGDERYLAFSAWIAEVREDLTGTISKVREAGTNMDLAALRDHVQELQEMTGSYVTSLDALSLPSSLEPARWELREALAELEMAVEHGAKGIESMDLAELDTAVDHLDRAMAHLDTALGRVGGSV